MNKNVNEARNITLVMDFYELTMSYNYFKQGMKDEIVYFDMFLRTLIMAGWSLQLAYSS